MHTGTIPISTLLLPGRAAPKAFTRIELSSPTSGTFAASSVTGTIVENPPITLSIDDATSIEGGNEVFHVTLSQAVATDTTFTYVTQDGAATNGTAAKTGTDYTGTGTPITVTIPAGQTTATFSIPTLDPGIAGLAKTFTVALANPSTGITLGDATGTGTITNTHAPSVAINDVQILEGNDPAHPNMAVFTVTLSHAVPDQSVVLQYFTVDGTATSVGTAKDFTGISANTPATLTFAPGETTKTISIPIIGDTTKEADEHFSVKLTEAANGNVVLTKDTGQGTILNDDGVIDVQIGNATVLEGKPGDNNQAVFTITLSQPSSTPVTINYTTVDGTATGNADYTPVIGTITFAPNQTTQTISVPIVGDTVKEIDEQFQPSSLSIPTTKDSKGNDISTEPALELAGTGIGTGTIVDDDSFVGISIGDVTITEGDSGQKMAVFTVKLSQAPASPITLNFTTSTVASVRPWRDQFRPKRGLPSDLRHADLRSVAEPDGSDDFRSDQR